MNAIASFATTGTIGLATTRRFARTISAVSYAGEVAPGFMNKLVDWRDFERFVRDLYAEDPNLTVEHNVTMVGRSGAARQIDVKFTHRAGGHTYVTLIECKRWKDKVSRDRVDVLAAAIEDLRASKGIIFTTAGYEPGAEAYAREKGIELFLVRDLTDAEWGQPGRVVWFYMHFYGGHILRVDPGQAQLITIGAAPPPATLNLDLRIEKDAPLDPALTLHSVTEGSAGPNLMEVVLEARRRILETVAAQVGVFADGANGAKHALVIPVRLDLRGQDHRELRRPFGGVRLEQLGIEFLVTIDQTRFEFDRGQELDLAVAVEDYMSEQRRVVTRGPAGEGLAVFDLGGRTQEPVQQEDVLQNGSVLNVFLEAWVLPGQLTGDPPRADEVTCRLPEWEAVGS